MKAGSYNLELKEKVGLAAANLVQNGMTVGIGTGSTVEFFIRELGRRVKGEDLNIKGITTSHQSKILCYHLGIPVLDVGMTDQVDLAVDGADEIDHSLNAIKGGGAAHTIEKIVAAMAQQFILIGDESKLVDHLGLKFPIPIEVIPEAMSLVLRRTKAIGADPRIRMAVKKDGPVISDNGNFIIDLYFKQPQNLPQINNLLLSIPGVIETGLFIGMASKAFIAGAESIKILTTNKEGGNQAWEM